MWWDAWDASRVFWDHQGNWDREACPVHAWWADRDESDHGKSVGRATVRFGWEVRRDGAPLVSEEQAAPASGPSEPEYRDAAERPAGPQAGRLMWDGFLVGAARWARPVSALEPSVAAE